MPIGTGTAILAGSALSAGSSLLGSGKASSAASDASNLQKEMYLQTRSDLSPYNVAGQSALGSALSLAQGSPTGGGPDYVTAAYQNLPSQAGAMTQAELEKTPGYQFTLSQGLKSTQAANAAKGLGVSGAALKGAATYATGLADSTYANRFNEAQQSFTDYINLNTAQQGNLTNQFNRLNALTSTGENAAAQTGVQGTSLANAAGNYLSQSGQYSAAGTTGAASAVNQGLQNYLGYNMYQKQNTGGTGNYPSGNVSGNQNNSDLLQGSYNVGGNTWYS